MASPYPAFIWHDPVEAQQQMAHAQAINEGMRIQELGKARQAQGMLQMAQMQQQQKAQREKNELDRMLALSQIEQNRIANEFREKELMQRGTLEAERNKNYAERSRLEFSPDRIFPQEALLERKIELEEEDRKRQEAAELGIVTEAERALVDLDRKAEALSGMEANDPKGQYINPPVIQSRRNTINLQRKEILDGMKKKGYDYDPTSRKFIGVNRSAQIPTQPSQSAPPQASSLLGNVGGMIDLTPFQKATLGLRSGQSVVQDGVTYIVR